MVEHWPPEIRKKKLWLRRFPAMATGALVSSVTVSPNNSQSRFISFMDGTQAFQPVGFLQWEAIESFVFTRVGNHFGMAHPRTNDQSDHAFINWLLIKVTSDKSK
jgi:hypothetical protein